MTETAPTTFDWTALQNVVKEHRSKVPVSRHGTHAGVHIQVGWLLWHQLSSDPEFLRRGWARCTPVVFEAKPAIWVPALKAFITIVPEVLPPKVEVEGG